MTNNPKIVKRMINGERAGIFHSSAYGRAQSGSTMGAASSESFAERRKVDENRQNIRKYSDSMVAEQRFNSEAAGATRLDNPTKVGSENGAGYYEDMLQSAKKGMETDLGETEQMAIEARKRLDEAKKQTQQVTKGAAGGRVVGRTTGGQAGQQRSGIGAAQTNRANLYNTAEKRAEMSARFAGRTGRTGAGQNGNAGRTPMAPRATRPPRGL